MNWSAGGAHTGKLTVHRGTHFWSMVVMVMMVMGMVMMVAVERIAATMVPALRYPSENVNSLAPCGNLSNVRFSYF